MSSASLIDHLSRIDDPRMDRTKKHLLIDILVITVLGFIAGNNNWFEIIEWAEEQEDWLKTILKLENGIPSHDTFGRVFALIDPEQFEEMFQAWAQEYRQKFLSENSTQTSRPHVAIDEKKSVAPPPYVRIDVASELLRNQGA